MKKQHKANKRAKKEKQFRDNHPLISSLWPKTIRPLLLIASLVSLAVMGLIAWVLWGQYQDSVYWTDHHAEEVVMANQPPSLLYDSNEASKNAKMNFTSIVETTYNKETGDFTEHMEQAAMDQLQAELNAMTDDEYKQTYIDQYDALSHKWDIEQAYRNLYADENRTRIKADVTPHQIIELNNKTFETIDTYSLESNHADQFAIRIHDWQTKLLEDALAIQNKVLELSQWLTQKEDGYTVQADLYPDYFNQYKTKLDDGNLHYTWNNTNKFQNIVTAISDVTEEYQQRHEEYVTYLEDVEQGEEARAEHQQRLDTAQANLQNVQGSINGERQAIQENTASIRQSIEDLQNQLNEAQDRAEDERNQIQEDVDQTIKDVEQRRQEEQEAQEEQEQREEERRQQENEEREKREQEREEEEQQEREEEESSSDDNEENESEDSESTDEEDASRSENSDSNESNTSSDSNESDESNDSGDSGFTEDRLKDLIGEPLPEDLSIPYEARYEESLDEDTENVVITDYEVDSENEVVRFTLGTE